MPLGMTKLVVLEYRAGSASGGYDQLSSVGKAFQL
jgi:hypothetical protein